MHITVQCAEALLKQNSPHPFMFIFKTGCKYFVDMIFSDPPGIVLIFLQCTSVGIHGSYGILHVLLQVKQAFFHDFITLIAATTKFRTDLNEKQ